MSHRDTRQRPHVSIPPGAQAPVNPSPTARMFSPYAFEVQPPPYLEGLGLSNPWDNQPQSPDTARPRTQSMQNLPPRPLSRTSSAIQSGSSGFMAFPEPQIYRSVSQHSNLHPGSALGHRHSKSDLTSTSLRLQKDPSTTSFVSNTSSYYPTDDSDYYSAESSLPDDEDFSRELSNLSLDSEEGLRRFQAGELPEKEEEWHRLVPPEAREALGKQEVQRQSVIFEVFKSEREYVFDLQAVKEVFIEPLRNASPPIIAESLLPAFISEVFGNLSQILAHHERMLGALFSRQREQHPLIQSAADIILDTTLKSDFRSAYETYIKHYPLAESHHRKELKRNRAYQSFILSAASDPRIRKRDLITFLSRPVTRLPRLNLLLEQILKLTDVEYEHPDLETLPIILSILKDCIKSTQPGIEAAESKVKFWGICESLSFQKGEIIDMDLYDESRTLVYAGPAARRTRTESGFSGWVDLNVALLDNYLMLTREDSLPNGAVKRTLMSRPLPLSYLCLGSFTSPPENRRERADDGRRLESLRYHNVPIYPFTIYHASSKSDRRYTLCVASEALRNRWHSALVDAIGVHKARQEANMWFDPRSLTDRYFRMMGSKVVNTSAKLTGRITSAVPFASGGKKFIAVGCPGGIYVSPLGEEKFIKALDYSNPTSLAAIQTLGKKVFNKFIVHFEYSMISYSLDILARVALGQAQPKTLEASREKLVGQDSSNVLFFRHAQVGQRILIVYASKRLLGVSLTLNVLEVVDTSEATMTPRRTNGAPLSFRPFGDSGSIPKVAHDIIPLVKTIAICTQDGIIIADPTNLGKSSVTIVPDMTKASTNGPMSNLKTRTDSAKPLGLVRCDDSELMVVYDTIGCYITKHGSPSRSSGYIKWESKATSYAHRGVHVLLFSPQFIEIRNVTTGRLVQVIEATDLRLLHCGPKGGTDDMILAARKGTRDDKEGVSDKIIELVETSEITTATTPALPVPALWDEWDM